MQFMCWLLSLLLRAALVSREPPYGTSSYNKHFITTTNIVHSYLLTLWNCVFSLLDLPIKTLLCMFGGVLAWNYDSTLILQCLSMVFNEICINILTWKHWQIKITSFGSNIAWPLTVTRVTQRLQLQAFAQQPVWGPKILTEFSPCSLQFS